MATPLTVIDAPTAADPGPSADERDERLTAGADELVGGRRSLLAHPQLLLIVAATLMTSGLTAILLAWAGVSRSILVEEQMAYVVSGGLLGLALAIIGALAFFAHWLTVSIREARLREALRQRDHLDLMAALADLTAAVALPRPSSNGRGPKTKAE